MGEARSRCIVESETHVRVRSKRFVFFQIRICARFFKLRAELYIPVAPYQTHCRMKGLYGYIRLPGSGGGAHGQAFENVAVFSNRKRARFKLI